MIEILFYILFCIAFGILAYKLIKQSYTEEPFVKKTKIELTVLAVIIVLSGMVMVYNENHIHNENFEHHQR